MSVSLATGLYAVHCLIPPHPGASAAAGIVGVEFGKLILIGTLVAIPAAIAGYLWANYAGKKIPVTYAEENLHVEESSEQPPVIKAFLPVIVPILLIALKSFFIIEDTTANAWISAVLSLGDPVIAFIIGVLLAFNYKRKWRRLYRH